MKFGIIPRAEGLSCLRQLVYYFHGHLIDMAAAMIENGGMYMYRLDFREHLYLWKKLWLVVVLFVVNPYE